MALTEKMKSFCREYFSNGGNGTQAYLTTYDSTSDTSAAVESSRLLARTDIQEYLQSLNKPLETKAISEREKKRAVLWDIINNGDYQDKCRAMDILNKMDAEYVNINRNIVDKPADIVQLDTDVLRRLSETG